MRTYFYLFKLQVLRQLAYRFEALFGFAFSVVPLAVMVSLWRSVYTGEEVEGVSEYQMVNYAVLAIALKDVLYFKTQDKLLAAAKSGDIAIDLMRPYSVLFRYLVEDCAQSVCTAIRRLVPLVILSWIVVQPLLPSDLGAALLFIPSILLSYIILWLISAQVGIIALWQMEIGTLGYVKDAVVRILSGSIVPIWFFPDALKTVSALLPFQYTVQSPLGIFVGRIEYGEAGIHLLIQLAWVLILALVLKVSWRAITTRIGVQGG